MNCVMFVNLKTIVAVLCTQGHLFRNGWNTCGKTFLIDDLNHHLETNKK